MIRKDILNNKMRSREKDINLAISFYSKSSHALPKPDTIAYDDFYIGKKMNLKIINDPI